MGGGRVVGASTYPRGDVLAEDGRRAPENSDGGVGTKIVDLLPNNKFDYKVCI